MSEIKPEVSERSQPCDVSIRTLATWEDDGKDGDPIDTSSIADLNHQLSSADVDGVARDTTEHWQFEREPNVGSLRAVTNVDFPSQVRWGSSRPRLSGPTGEVRGFGHRLDSVAVDQSSNLIEHAPKGSTLGV